MSASVITLRREELLILWLWPYGCRIHIPPKLPNPVMKSVSSIFMHDFLRLASLHPKRHLNRYIRFFETHSLTDRPRNIDNDKLHWCIVLRWGLKLFKSIIPCAPQRAPFYFLITLSKINRFYNFWSIKSWVNLTWTSYRFVHLTCRM